MKVRAYWIGGPADGGFTLMEEEHLKKVITVVTGTKANPQRRHVTPVHTPVRWVLPYYEGQIVKERNE